MTQGGAILIIEDDRTYAKVLADTLSLDELPVEHVTNAEAGLKKLKEGPVALVILDFNLPGMTGLQALQKIRQDAATSAVPVIMLTVKADEPHKIRGLEVGADDYVAKTASLQEVQARVRALLRRSKMNSEPVEAIESPPFRLDWNARDVRVDGKSVSLTQSEFDILAALLRRRGSVLSYEGLSGALTTSKDATSQSIYVHINNLRKKLGRRGELIETVHGIGYKLAQ